MDITEPILDRYFLGEASPEEVEAIGEWLSESPEHEKVFQEALNLHVNVSLALARIEGIADTEKAAAKPRKRTLLRRILITAASAAAVVAVSVWATWHGMISPLQERMAQTRTLVAEPGHQSRMVFEDGTEVILSGGSALTYPVVLADDIREVSIEGQAQFKVSKDAKRPFVVNTSRYRILVTGTTFDVLADAEGKLFSTALKEGSVTVTDRLSGESLALEPGQIAGIDNSGHLKLVKEGVEDQMIWSKGVVLCDGLSFQEIMSLFERRYGVHIVIERDDIPEGRAQRMRLRDSEGIESALKVLQLSGWDFKFVQDSNANTYYIR